jgi:hypothetical protein
MMKMGNGVNKLLISALVWAMDHGPWAKYKCGVIAGID